MHELVWKLAVIDSSWAWVWCINKWSHWWSCIVVCSIDIWVAILLREKLATNHSIYSILVSHHHCTIGLILRLRGGVLSWDWGAICCWIFLVTTAVSGSAHACWVARWANSTICTWLACSGGNRCHLFKINRYYSVLILFVF